MFVYLINILSICVYALFFCRGEQTRMKKAFFLILCALQCTIVACIRYRIGTDYGWYYFGFIDMAESGFSEMTYGDWEIGFIFLNKVVALFTDSPIVFISICAVLSLSGTFYLIWRYSKNPFMSVFLFLNTYLFYLDLNYVRQAIAMSIMCFAYGFLKDRKFWRFLLLCVLAATFHLPVIYLLPVFFITYFKMSWKTIPCYVGVLVLYFLLSNTILNVLLKYFHQEYADTRFIKHGVYVYYAVYPLLLCVGMLVLVYWLDFRISRDFNMLTHLMLLTTFWQIAMTKHALFERFSYYTMPFLLVAVPEALNVFRDKFLENNKAELTKQYDEDSEGLQAALIKLEKKTSAVTALISAAVLILAFAYNMMGLIVPEHGVHGVLPFETVNGMKLPDIDHWFKR